ncbi:hypothetical protein WN48_07543 [Eufriesea mexicana]|uniref:Transmembrane and TPR repeat-containing protein n=1 Tax=Eufriesea mexicana TaxID=516756 RepID=A0A310SSG2_9HYME|nr:hypothetical protein WN48_07543 [Eufriesea mexicana]
MKLLVSTRGPCWAVAGQDRHFASQPHGVELNHPCGLTVDGTSPSASMCPSPSRVRLRQRTAPSRSEDALIRGGHPGTRCMTRLTVTGNECRRRVVRMTYEACTYRVHESTSRRLVEAYVNLGAALASVGRGTEAAAVLRAGASLDGSGLKDKRAHEAARVQALLQLGALYADQGRLQRALSAYREALDALPDHYPPQSVYNLLGETLSRLQQYAEAERWFQASLASQPDHVPAHITYGKLLARNSSRVLEAERWFLRARRLAPDDSSVHHHYGLFLTSQGRLSEAAEEQLRAAELSRSDYELSMAAASALRQADRLEDAEVWYRHAASLRPHEARSHTNLGAILHLNGKYKQAAAAYSEALRLQPGDATTIMNLHKLAAILA